MGYPALCLGRWDSSESGTGQVTFLHFLWQEREDANALFKSKKGKELQKEIAKKSKTFVPGAGLSDTAKPSGNFLSLSACLLAVDYFVY